MHNTQMPNIPGATVMTDTLDFVKNLWGSMSVPGLTAPTLSVEELDKKINDLKAVEAWLNLNMNMLRGSIQALEVQRGTIATLKSVGASMAAAVSQGGAAAGESKSIFDANPYASAFFHHARQADKDKSPPPAPPAAAPSPRPAPEPAPAASATDAATAAATAAAAAPMGNPAVWWNLLQDQFKQAVSTAMASESMMVDAAARVSDTAAKFAAAAAKPAKSAKPADGADSADSPAVGTAGAKTKAKPAAVPGAATAAVKKEPAKRAPAKTKP